MNEHDTDRAQLAALGAHVEQPALAVGDHIAPIGDDPTKPGPVGHCWSDGFGLYSIHWFDRYGDFMHRHPVELGPVPKGYQRLTSPRPLVSRGPVEQPTSVEVAHQALCDLVIEDGADTPREVKDACALIGALVAVNAAWPPTEGQIAEARQRVASTRGRGPVEQPAPVPSAGDVWREIIDGEPLSVLRELYAARRALGIERYGVPLQRGNQRDTARDLEEELLDALAYATALEWWGVADPIRAVLRRVVTRRRSES